MPVVDLTGVIEDATEENAIAPGLAAQRREALRLSRSLRRRGTWAEAMNDADHLRFTMYEEPVSGPGDRPCTVTVSTASGHRGSGDGTTAEEALIYALASLAGHLTTDLLVRRAQRAVDLGKVIVAVAAVVEAAD